MRFRQLLPLVFLAFLIPNIAAVSSCSEIQLNTSTVRVARNSEATVFFVVENRGAERFFIDSTEVLDNVSGLIASAAGFDRMIDAGGFGAVGVRVKALKDVDVKHANGVLRLRGHFLGGKECSFQDIGNRQFDILVEEKPISSLDGAKFRACSGIIVANPADFAINGREMVLRIKNDTAYRATIRMAGQGLRINPGTISVPEHSDVIESIRIESSLAESWLLFRIDNAVCNAVERTRILKETGEKEEEKKSGVIVEEVKQPPKDENAGIFATAFAALGQNTVFWGIIILAIIVIAWLFVHGRKRILLDRQHKILLRQ